MADHITQTQATHAEAAQIDLGSSQQQQEENDHLSPAEQEHLRHDAQIIARGCAWLPPSVRSGKPRELFRRNLKRLNLLEKDLYELQTEEPSDDLRWLYDNLRLVRTDLQDLHDGVRVLAKLPSVRTGTEEAIPRCIVLSRALLAATHNRLTEEALTCYLEGVQTIEPLRLSELSGMLLSLKLSLLELLAQHGRQALDAFRAQGEKATSYGLGNLITSLRLIGWVDWRNTLEHLSLVHHALQLDPCGAYSRMEFISREAYRMRVARIAGHSDVGEIELAQLAVTMAEDAAVERDAPEALRERLRHVGYYLMDDIGSKELLHRVGYRRGFAANVQHVFRAYPDETYIIGIEFASLMTVVVLIMSLVRSHEGFGLIMAALLLLLPATQAAVELMNYLVTAILTPHALSKLDFSDGIPPACATMVAIPTLLINDKQIRQLVDDLEIRYLVNRDPHIFFALLTDLPDTAEPAGDEDARIDLALRLIHGLNRRYAGAPYGGFYMFHRHRVYNPREGAWMGFERKRGKLLDLNQLLRGAFDPFPVKAGDLSRLPKIRYVLTLDSDTKLPRDSAHRMIGTMAHPLNQPLIDPELNIVTRGYGILQPRVGISVQSSTRSRLANIYSGQTGFDIYSRAVSDVYQDLYGEGIFTGKGIYDVDALRQVLEHRFPRNALLSHDLIEGAYARVGLASDIEVIDDYPSHYSAYNRRKHRWLRGDWQIVRWILNKVPDESRRLVSNPISLVSRWKIMDNLRRSLMEPATFFLLVAGWFFLPGGPGFWTCISLALLFLPIYFRLIFALIAAASVRKWDMAHEAFIDFFTSHINIVLNLAFLAHQALVAIYAIVRTVIRIYVTHSRLLEWETATEAELDIQKRTPVDIYLNWLPALTACLALALFLRPAAAPWALPLLITWCCSKFISTWINRPPHRQDVELSPKDRVFLRGVALRTWRYFEKFSNEGNHYLIPDNVREQPFRVDERISPTNLGLLLNSRQAALEFGYLTHAEFMSLTEKTLQSILKLPRFHGHFTNWYDTLKMQPIGDLFISSVDNGNFVASLWSLKEGCLDLLHEPLLRQSALDSLADHHRTSSGKANSRDFWNGLFKLSAVQEWLPRLLRQAPEELGDLQPRVNALREQAQDFTPWYLPEYEPLRGASGLAFGDAKLTPGNCASYYRDLENRLQQTAIQPGISGEVAAQARRLRDQLPACRRRLEALAARLQSMYDSCQQLSDEMNFSMLVDKGRNLLSIGYDARAEKLNKACYDLLASEARSATFITVAKGEAVQDAWFKLGRQHTVCEKEMAMISWTGTMFEYLMPAIWMKSHPNTLLDRAARSAVRAQQSYGKSHRVPWGISEAAYSKTDADGSFQYAAFGVPGLALNVARAGSLVISPYSSCLALAVDPVASVQNLMVMARKDWLAEYGFYESADYTGSSGGSFRERKYKLVHCWMAHHQGMSLAAICNTLYNDVFQRWFHAERLVQASDLILQERPLRVKPIADFQPRRVMAFDAKSADAHAN